MIMNNNMTSLLNKIERRLGTQQLNLPEHLQKDKWYDVIVEDTLDTFSRFFPDKIEYCLTPQNKKETVFNGIKKIYWLIDESIQKRGKIIGVGDIRWHDWSTHFPGLLYGGVQSYDMMANGVDFETITDTQMMADHNSAFSNGIYVKYTPPNKIELNIVIAANFITENQSIPIDLFLKHDPSLQTIEPTKMETFEKLAIADVANFLYSNLKYFDQLETVYGTVDLKLDFLREKAEMRDEIVRYLEENYVSAANMNMPAFITVS